LLFKKDNFFEKDLVITDQNMRLLVYNIYYGKITSDKPANANYFNSFNKEEVVNIKCGFENNIDEHRVSNTNLFIPDNNIDISKCEKLTEFDVCQDIERKPKMEVLNLDLPNSNKKINDISSLDFNIKHHNMNNKKDEINQILDDPDQMNIKYTSTTHEEFLNPVFLKNEENPKVNSYYLTTTPPKYYYNPIIEPSVDETSTHIEELNDRIFSQELEPIQVCKPLLDELTKENFEKIFF